MKKLKRYFWNILIGLDQLVNAFLGGDPDETISSRAGKLASKRQWAYYLCRVLHIFDPGHCKKSIEEDEGDRSVVE